MGLTEKVKTAPKSAGVYIFKDRSGKILYIGKASNLRERLKHYLSKQLTTKTQAFVSKIKDLECICTISDAQAQLLEASLIKKYQPPYNISLRDDKSFPLIRFTAEDFPQISIFRRKTIDKNDKALYFGPYTNSKLLFQALKDIRKIFGFRSCRKLPKRACLYYRLKLCPAPCIGKISKRGYQEILKEISMFLDSRYEELLGKLAKKMEKASKSKNFEEAAKIRDRISALSVFGQGGTVFNKLAELEDLRKLLGLIKVPERIEAFDISNIFGKEASGAMVSFYQGVPDKNNYRRFRIKITEGIDDYAMIREVVQRRYAKLVERNLTLPDLIVIDGGKGHLLTANQEIKKLGIDIEMLGIAKPSRIESRDKLYIKGREIPIRFTSDTPALNLLRRIRNEAHRFALAYHHLLRKKKTLR